MGKLPMRKSSGNIYLILKEELSLFDTLAAGFQAARRFELLTSFLSARRKHIVDEQERAHRYACVRDIEDGPVERAIVSEYEIDHEAETHAVCQIAQDACQQKRARAQDSIIVARGAKEIVEHGHARDACERHKEPAAERAALLKLSEGDAVVLRIDEGNEAVYQLYLAPEVQGAQGPCLRRLIYHIDAERRQKI